MDQERINHYLEHRIDSADHRLTSLEQTFKESFEFIKENMATKADLMELRMELRAELHGSLEDQSRELTSAWRTDIAAAKYQIIDAVDRKFEDRDHRIRTIKTAITSFHPTAFTK